MDQLYAHHKLLEVVEQVKVTTYQCWISVYGPLFWLISATILHWNSPDTKQEFDFTDSIEFMPLCIKEEEKVAPWESEPIQTVETVETKKLSHKRSFKVLKEQITGWKQKRPNRLEKRQLSTPSLPLKEIKMPFLRRFSSSSDCSQYSEKKKSLRTLFSQSESIRKLKSFNFKLKQ
ncbi:unnamed protein product [Rhizopus stolonifer]